MSTQQLTQRSEVGADLGERMHCTLALDQRDDLTVRCEVTGKWCKVRNFRPCTIRVEFLRRRGIDIYDLGGSKRPKNQGKSAVKTRRGRG